MPLAVTTGIIPRRHLLHRGPLKWGHYLHPGLPLALVRAKLVMYSPSGNDTSKMLLLHTHFGTHSLSHECQEGLPCHGVLE